MVGRLCCYEARACRGCKPLRSVSARICACRSSAGRRSTRIASPRIAATIPAALSSSTAGRSHAGRRSTCQAPPRNGAPRERSGRLAPGRRTCRCQTQLPLPNRRGAVAP
ncbi:hypothetical protein T492DRAFT_1000896 [Pavlovales sp. CCMP2436]|nr:hypothetical protein T492DRAFT_1000896 [Pavlovales sp. CCMP2436]